MMRIKSVLCPMIRGAILPGAGDTAKPEKARLLGKPDG
jgi:hypothetical protein